MHESLAAHALSEPGLSHEIDGALLEHARAYALLDILAAAALEHDRLDADTRKQMGEHQPRGPRTDDADLRSLAHVLFLCRRGERRDHLADDAERGVCRRHTAVD